MIINKKKSYKKIIIICIVIVLLFLITIILINYNKNKSKQHYIEQEIERVKQYTSLTDFKSIEEVCLYLKCNYSKTVDSKLNDITYDVYMELPVKYSMDNNNVEENKGFTEKLIQYSAYVLKYKNFRIIDEKNETSIVVICNEEQQLVSTYSINNIENYFSVKENEQNIQSYKTSDITEFECSSEILKEIISNKWKINNLHLGTKESMYRGYDIYFDEGIQVRNVSNKVFNIIFTDKYKDKVVNDLGINSSIEEIKKSLGNPTFESGQLIGYKGKEMYVFFYNNQISVYRIEDYEYQDFLKILENKISDDYSEKTFVDDIKKLWTDYDIYQYGENEVQLQYTLKGVKVKYDSTMQKGVIIYNNFYDKCYGNISLEEIVMDKDYVFFENKDLIFEEEKNRVDNLDDITKGNNYILDGVINNISRKYKTYKKPVNSEKTAYSIRFISINNENPNSELREYINYAIWLDNENFIYSVKDRGIFLYNVTERTYKTLVTGKECDYRLKVIIDGILYYDDNELKLDI